MDLTKLKDPQPAATCGEVGVTPGTTTTIKLKKKIGIFAGVAIVIGLIMGTGIFITPSIVLVGSGSIGLTLIVWMMAGVLSLAGAMCYLELGAMIAESGGDYIYIHTAFGPLPGFLYVWVTTMLSAPTMIAIMATAFSNYLFSAFFDERGCEAPTSARYLVSAACLTLVTALNIYSVKWVLRAQLVCTGLVSLALCSIIIIGAVNLSHGQTGNFENVFRTVEGLQVSGGSVAGAFYGALFAFGGWSILNFLIEELRNPVRDLPIIIIVSLPLVTLINVLVNLAYFTVLNPAEMLASSAVAFTFGHKVLPREVSWLFPVAVAISVIGAINGGLLKGSRTCMVGARKGHFPSYLAMIQVKNKTPAPALLFVTAIALLYLSSNDIGKLITYFSIMTWSTYVASTVGLLYLRWKRPEWKRPFKVNILAPIVFSLAGTSLLIFGVIGSPFEALMGLFMILSGIPVYLVFIHWNSKPQWIKACIYSTTVFLQKVVGVGIEDVST